MIRATNTNANLSGEDRDVVAMRNRIKQEATKNLPSAEDLDKIAEEIEIAKQTSK